MTDKVNLSVTADILFFICLMWLFPFRFEIKRDGIKGDDFYESADYVYNTFKSRYHFSLGPFPVGKFAVFYMVFYILLSIFKQLFRLFGG